MSKNDKKTEETTSVETTSEPTKTASTTKTLIYTKFPVNRHTVFSYKEYKFMFNSKLEPVPVKVPSDIATVLLAMVDEGCRCHTPEKPHKLFKEVN